MSSRTGALQRRPRAARRDSHGDKTGMRGSPRGNRYRAAFDPWRTLAVYAARVIPNRAPSGSIGCVRPRPHVAAVALANRTRAWRGRYCAMARTTVRRGRIARHQSAAAARTAWPAKKCWPARCTARTAAVRAESILSFRPQRRRRAERKNHLSRNVISGVVKSRVMEIVTTRCEGCANRY